METCCCLSVCLSTSDRGLAPSLPSSPPLLLEICWQLDWHVYAMLWAEKDEVCGDEWVEGRELVSFLREGFLTGGRFCRGCNSFTEDGGLVGFLG